MRAKLITIVLILSGMLANANVSYGCNIPPEAILKVLRQYVIVGRNVLLDGSDSYDPDPQDYISKYEWDFTDNGTYDYYEISSSKPDGAFDGKVTYTYYSSGTYTVRLRVSDSASPSPHTDTDTCVVHIGPDSDNDGLPHDWEVLYDLDDANFADADIDSDSDNYNNLCEYLHDSEPNKANSLPSSNITIYVPADVNSIQRAINASINGDTIVVSKGIYHEHIDFHGKKITLTSTDPNSPEVVVATVIDANGTGVAVTFNSLEDANSVLKGFTITGGLAGIYCAGTYFLWTSPKISNCVVTENGGGNGEVSYWKMDDNAANTTVVDSSGNGNNGTAQQNTSALHTTGKIKGALTFNGSTDRIDVSSNETLTFADKISVSLWVKWDTLSDWRSLVHGTTSGSWDSSYWLATSSSTNMRWSINGDNSHDFNPDNLQTGQWYHIVATYNGSNGKVYVNGVLKNTFSRSGNINNENGVRLGLTGNGEYRFDGTLDDVRVFNRALTAAEVRVLYHSGGGGICCASSASPTITNCVFHSNFANYGGGIYDNSSSPTVTSCVFVGNTADVNGGGMYNSNSSPVVTNCTFSGNYAADDGGGMYNNGTSNPDFANCILCGDQANGTGDEVYNAGSADPNFSYCDIEGCGGSGAGWDPNLGSDDGGNIDSDPEFIDADDPDGLDGIFGNFDDGLQLQYLQQTSPCIDAADGDSAPSTDITGRARSNVRTISNTGNGDPNYADIGAYECPMIWFVDKDATGSNNGTSWANAFTSLQSALSNASDGDEIWVAEGTYKPTTGTSRSISFELVQGVGIYGEFAGTEAYRNQRDWTKHTTILSGDIGTQGSQSDNSYHVIKADVTTKSADRAIVDGFTIKGGNANSLSSPNYYGGGIYCNGASPTISNCAITGNSAKYGGGIYNRGLHWSYWRPGIAGILNCTFSGNSATYYGGALNNSQSSPTVTNCTFSGNQASYGGAVYEGNCLMKATNCIFWGDTATYGPEIYNYSYIGNPTFRYCDIQGCGGSSNWNPNFGSNAGGNIDNNPIFADGSDPDGTDNLYGTLDDGLRLMTNSPCIDAADGDVAPSKDVLMLGRIDVDDVNNAGTGSPEYVDMGAYEAGYDSDGDGMPDDWEIKYNLNPVDPNDAGLDGDQDGLTNLEEYQHGTDPADSDSDNDGMPDGWEVDHGLNPLSNDANADPDNDGLSNLGEYNNNADPHDADSDDDYMPDGWEVSNNLEPDDNTGINGANGNPDSDAYTNLSEYLHGSNPRDSQSVPTTTTTITVPTETGSIQSAIDLSINGDIIEVLRGIYFENINFNGRAITVTGTAPNDWWVVESTIIDAQGASQVVLFNNGEDSNSVLKGLTLTNGTYGISCSSSPTISWCIIEKNSSHGIYCTAGSPLITNNMIGENTGDGIYSSSSTPVIKNSFIYKNAKGIEFGSGCSDATVRNNTIADNTNYGIYCSGSSPTITNCILWNPNADDLASCSATYSCIKNNDPGEGNIHSDPQFIDPDSYDYRLQRTSPCINAGTGTYSNETDIEGQVRMAKSIDMGADEVCEIYNVTQDIWYSGVDNEDIQDAINAANNNDVIRVYEWTFSESISFSDVNITLTSHDPNNWAVVATTIIDAENPNADVVTFSSGQDANSVLIGLTLTGGKNGVYCSNSSSPKIIACLITENDSSGIECVSGSPNIIRCKISQNSGDGIKSSSTTPTTIKSSWIYKNAKGISFSAASSVAAIHNNTIADNSDYGISVSSGTEPNISNCIVWGHDSNDLIDCNATYSCIEDPNDASGVGNITSDPQFSDAVSNDYHLTSASPCRNSGDANGIDPNEKDIDNQPLIVSAGNGKYVTDQGADQERILYVTGVNNNPGYSPNPWERTYANLQDAINAVLAGTGDEIWVKQGTYLPTEPAGRDATFTLVNGVEIYGGFLGNEIHRYERNWLAHETILSGDIDATGYQDSYHVVTGADGAILDGFIIEKGYADGNAGRRHGGGMFNYMCKPIVKNCLFRNNYAKQSGGGIANCGAGADTIITNCIFQDNQADDYGGGGIENWYCSPTIDKSFFIENDAYVGGGVYNGGWASTSIPLIITNCVFYKNTAPGGGGMCNDATININKPTITNCTFAYNLATLGRSVYDYATYSKFTNCIMWGNSTDQFYEQEPTYPTVTYCDIKCTGTYPGVGNINSDPLFVDSDDCAGNDGEFGNYDDGLHLKPESPCIDAGYDQDVPDDDAAYNERPFDYPGVNNNGALEDYDMGAYEASMFRFTVTNDNRNKTDNWRHVLTQINEKFPDDEGVFHISPGDIDPPADTWSDLSHEPSVQYPWGFGPDVVLWFPVVGNHEVDEPISGNPDIAWIRNTYYPILLTNIQNKLGKSLNLITPQNCRETMYSFDYQNAHFVVLNEYYNGTSDCSTSNGYISDATYSWLVQDLQGNRKPLVFVFGHEPAYPKYRHWDDCLNRNIASRDRFWELLNDEKVAAYICGHTHFYYRKKVGGAGYNWEPFTWQIDVGNAGNQSPTDQGGPMDGMTFTDITVTDTGINFDVWHEDNGESSFGKDDSWGLPDLAIQVSSFPPEDATERINSNGSVDLYSGYLPLGYDWVIEEMVGIRFQNVRIPQSASIEEAYVQFTARGATTGACTLTIRGQKSPNASAFSTSPYNISNRLTTDAYEEWNSVDWNTGEQAGAGERTPNIGPTIIEEIVGQTGPNGWQSGNSLVIIITGTGTRKAWSCDGKSGTRYVGYNYAPVLYVKVAK